MTYREIEKLILKDGWMVTRQRGSHRQYKHPEKKRTRDHRAPQLVRRSPQGDRQQHP